MNRLRFWFYFRIPPVILDSQNIRLVSTRAAIQNHVKIKSNRVVNCAGLKMTFTAQL